VGEYPQKADPARKELGRLFAFWHPALTLSADLFKRKVMFTTPIEFSNTDAEVITQAPESSGEAYDLAYAAEAGDMRERILALAFEAQSRVASEVTAMVDRYEAVVRSISAELYECKRENASLRHKVSLSLRAERWLRAQLKSIPQVAGGSL
jgi:hypothetical protein